MLPALLEHDVKIFGEALYEFNVRVGEMFAPIQGGVYSAATVAELVGFLRGEGVAGVGQSSWGPAVFAVVGDVDRASQLAQVLRNCFVGTGRRVLITSGFNRGSELVI